jgi:hypothetical protein
VLHHAQQCVTRSLSLSCTAYHLNGQRRRSSPTCCSARVQQHSAWVYQQPKRQNRNTSSCYLCTISGREAARYQVCATNSCSSTVLSRELRAVGSSSHPGKANALYMLVGVCVCAGLPAVDIASLQTHSQSKQRHQEHCETHDQPNIHATERALLVALLHLGVVFDRSVHSVVPACVASAIGAAVLLLRHRHALAAPQPANGLLRMRHHARPSLCVMAYS